MAKAESGLRQRIAAALRLQGWLVESNPASASTGRGRSDFTICARGRFFAVEVKVPGEQPDPHQERYGRKVVRAGGVYIVATSPEQAVYEITRHLTWRRYP